jgi:hypothetical protein
MRSIILDELRNEEIDKIKEYLKDKTTLSNIENLYWLYLQKNVLSDKQKELENQKGPYKISIEIGSNYVKFELLIRAEMITNEGSAEVNEEQLIFIYKFIEEMVQNLNLVSCK